MNLSAIRAAGAAELKLLEQLLLYKLSDNELDIGISYKSGETYAIVSYDEYDHQEVNVHLYCTPLKQFLLEVDNHNSPKTVHIAKEDLLLIPQGLQNLMQQAALKGKSMFFKPDQLT
ncbi:MAG: hypothetical protein NVSMB24_38400 [Mucilaginibacter sp.]